MSEGDGCGNRKSDVASLGRKLKLHLLVYIIDRTSHSTLRSGPALGFWLPKPVTILAVHLLLNIKKHHKSPKK
jgi:hypothetical protein